MSLQPYTGVNQALPMPTSTRTSPVWETPLYRSSIAQFEPSTWVKLLNPPTAFSFDEAWLLCQCSDQEWLAWIPDYGEIRLHVNEFCHLAE